ncbi:MAG: biotin-dependent carboxyltransferase family protein [Syntrophobacteraceae bacterium]
MNGRSIWIIEPGPLATVQDRGRYGYRSRGVPLSGAMDIQAFRVGNLLVGNDDAAAGIEITFGGFRVEFRCDACFALTGATAGGRLNGALAASWRAHPARKGDVLHVDAGGAGLRTYFAVSGGIELPPVMESRSTYLRGGFGGLDGRALRAGDELPLGARPGKAKDAPAPAALIPSYSPEPLLRAVPGPQDDRISPEGKAIFFSKWYAVTTRADRMGIALSGPVLDLPGGADIISDGTCPGAVQVHGNGQPTILGADCQTTGGYVKIAVVISSDLPLVAQLAPGDRVRFEEIDLWRAREIYLRNEYLIRATCSLRIC